MKRTKFLNCQIDFSRHNFLPRTETEFWVSRALKDSRFKIKGLEALDIFSGTGCMGIAVLKNIKNCQVDFSDISKNAVEQIKINSELNEIEKSRYKIYQSNLFEKLERKKYDYVFASPPYVALDRISEVQRGVLKNEPAAALFAGKDGLLVIRQFLKESQAHLKPLGKIFLEFDPLQKEKIAAILKKEGFRFLFRKDQFKKYRWLEAVKK